MLPTLTPEDVAASIPGATDVAFVSQGGQKVVFRAEIDGVLCAVKYIGLPDDPETADVEARAAREIDTMRACESPHMVKLGPVGLKTQEVAGQRVLFFTEEFIDGCTLAQSLQSRTLLEPSDVCRLGIEMADAIQSLWEIGTIHRDIKPGNIIRRGAAGDFVLLDAGYAFDVSGESLSKGMLVGTYPYFSPERFNYAARRSIVDFRSDMFSLGVTMYQVATGVHPFCQGGDDPQHVFSRILRLRPPPPSSVESSIPASLDAVILRMLGKSPHLRYRKIEHLVAALEKAGKL